MTPIQQYMQYVHTQTFDVIVSRYDVRTSHTTPFRSLECVSLADSKQYFLTITIAIFPFYSYDAELGESQGYGSWRILSSETWNS